MKIYVTSIFVDDQQKALEFYTVKLGFAKKSDIPLGEYRWLTVVSPDEPNGVELLLEPSTHRAVPPFKKALKDDKIPATSFQVKDVEQAVQRLRSMGVDFVQEPTPAGEVIIAMFDDTCGNLIQIMQS
jgi:catechol 2,3-dioxygenase-like lactoylglutathione lyase family enzyme